LAVTARFGLRANLPLDMELTFSRGRLSIECTRLPQPRGLSAYAHRDGISLHFDGHFYTATWWFVRIPLWSLAALFIALAAWPLWLTRASRRWALEGRCAFCGYLMTGLSEATCPECGKRS
jgi:hypothetical protein